MNAEELKEVRDGAATMRNMSKAGALFASILEGLLAHIDQQAEQIATLKTALTTEKAYHEYYKCQGDCGKAVCSAGSHRDEAKKQLAQEMPAIDWSET
jgi:tryptophan 2,3-dioxygenase